MKSLVMVTSPEIKKSVFKAKVYPNPSGEKAYLDFTLPEGGRITIELFNSNGQLLKTITNSPFEAGNHQLDMDMNGLPGGIYWVKFSSETNIETIKLIKTKIN